MMDLTQTTVSSGANVPAQLGTTDPAVRLLDAVTDRTLWLDRWSRSGREPFAHPSYGQLMAGPGERPVALVVQQGHSWALLPLIIRRLPDSLRAGGELSDAISPYGYGGPFFSGAFDVEALLAELEQWTLGSGLCSTFLRLSLEVELKPGVRTRHTEVVDVADNIVVDLAATPEQIWANYEHKVRKNVKKALRSGCSVRRDDRLDDVEAFLAVYGSTMRRRGASAWYHFDGSFFDQLGRDLVGCYSVFWVLDPSGRAVSVELVLESDGYLYSFLGGTLEDAFPMSPNDLLKHEAVLHGQRTGRKGFVLGGGFEKGDGIFRYKRAFDTRGVRSFRTTRVTGDRDLYHRLVDSRRRAAGRDIGDSYFPAYRAP